MISMFQTANGGWHWPSIVQAVAWLVAGAFILGTIYFNSKDRFRSATQINDLRAKVSVFEEKQAPWGLTEQQREDFASALKQAPRGKLAIEYSNIASGRVYDLAIDSKDDFKSLGYDVWGYVAGFQVAGGPPIIGIEVQIMDDESGRLAEAISGAFSTIGIKSRLTRRNNSNYSPETVVILVGEKP